MKTLRTRFCFLYIFLVMVASTANANDNTVHPEQFNLIVFIKASPNFLGANTTKIEDYLQNFRDKNLGSVCVCEILEVRNNNTQLFNVAVFAEKTNNGNISKGYKIAEREIAREKKLMKSRYFDDVKINTKIATATDCLSLYMKLKQEDSSLKLYDILDAN